MGKVSCKIHTTHPAGSSQLLGAVDLEDLTDGLGLLGAGLASAAAKDELGVELPGGGDLPGLGDLGVDQGVIVLEVGTETLGLESGPDGELLKRNKNHVSVTQLRL